MAIHPQFTYDSQGKPVGVFLSLEDWTALARNHPEWDAGDLPDWQKKILDTRLATPGDAVPLDDFLSQLHAGDAKNEGRH